MSCKLLHTASMQKQIKSENQANNIIWGQLSLGGGMRANVSLGWALPLPSPGLMVDVCVCVCVCVCACVRARARANRRACGVVDSMFDFHRSARVRILVEAVKFS